MATREIKTTLSLDGEKQFNSAISEAGRNMRVLGSEMKAATAEFEASGDEMAYLSTKSRTLGSQIKQQEEIVRALEQAVADSADAYADNSRVTDSYTIKLNNARAALSRLRKEHEDTDKRMEELGRDSERTGRRLEQGIGEAADDVSRKFDSMVNKLDSDIGSIRAMTSISAVVDVAGSIGGAVKGAMDSINDLTQSSAEYNRTMAFLKTNAEQAGIPFETIKRLAIEVSGITGDMDATIEGLSNLMASGFETDEMLVAVERLSGAIIQFPDTLKFESLSDGLQETIATGKAVGQYAEYLERMGLDLDVVNQALANAGKEGKEAIESVALSFLSGHGAEEALAKYREDNETLVKYFEAQAKLTEAQAKLGETVTPMSTAYIEALTLFFEGLDSVINTAIGFVEQWQDAFEKGLFKVGETVEEGREAVSSAPWAPGITTDGSTGANTYVETIPPVVKQDWSDINPGIDTGKTPEQIRQEARERAAEYKDAVEQFFDEMPITVPGWDELTPGIDVGNLKETIKPDAEKAAETYEDSIEEYFDANPIVIPGWDEMNPGIETGAYNTGKSICMNLGSAIEDYSYYPERKLSSLMSSLQAGLNRKITYPTINIQTPTVTSGTALASSGKTTIALDGKALGEATAQYNSAAMGEKLTRAELYG